MVAVFSSRHRTVGTIAYIENSLVNFKQSDNYMGHADETFDISFKNTLI